MNVFEPVRFVVSAMPEISILSEALMLSFIFSPTAREVVNVMVSSLTVPFAAKAGIQGICLLQTAG